jgi:hypothetical protein
VRAERRAAAAVILAVSCALAGCSSGPSDPPRDIQSARDFEAFPLYWLGERFERWDLTAILPLSGPAGFVTLIYGDCTPHGADEPSCTPPLQIQISALCSHLDAVARTPTWRQRRIRGAPVGAIDNAPVLFTRSAQVKMYRGEGADVDIRRRAFRALRSLNRVAPMIGAGDRIPGPAPGVLGGTRRCSS